MAWPANSSVLLVDDDPHIRRLISLRLDRSGFFILEAGNVADAIRILKDRDDVDLVCTDVEMPGSIDGIDLAAIVGARWPVIKIVVMSGRLVVHEDDLPAGSKFVEKSRGIGRIVSTIDSLMLAEPRLDLLAYRLRSKFAA